jgi:hypothetical protein
MLSNRFNYCFLFITLVSSNLLGQTVPDVAGAWNGVSRLGKTQYLVEVHFNQKGAILDGYLISRTTNKKDSAKILFVGSITNSIIELEETKFEYKTGIFCLANVKLTYASINGQETMNGKWAGDWRLSTCPPAVGGKIDLVKISGTNKNLSVVENNSAPAMKGIDTSDTFGADLYNELGERKYYALMIGINDYQDDRIQDLDHPVSDMQQVKDVLQSDYSFTPELTIALKNPTRDEIIVAFDELSKKITSKDQLLIFYAGHGIWDEKMQQGYWLPSDASKDSKARWLSNGTIRDYIGGINSKHTLLITDACFGGGIFKDRAVNFSNGKAILEMYKLPSRKAMTSGMLTTVPDKSVFVQYLVKNLKNNDQPLLSTEDLFRNFKIAVINNSSNGQVPQFGTIGQTGDEGGDFIFLRKGTN